MSTHNALVPIKPYITRLAIQSCILHGCSLKKFFEHWLHWHVSHSCLLNVVTGHVWKGKLNPMYYGCPADFHNDESDDGGNDDDGDDVVLIYPFAKCPYLSTVIKELSACLSCTIMPEYKAVESHLCTCNCMASMNIQLASMRRWPRWGHWKSSVKCFGVTGGILSKWSEWIVLSLQSYVFLCWN